MIAEFRLWFNLTLFQTYSSLNLFNLTINLIKNIKLLLLNNGRIDIDNQLSLSCVEIFKLDD